MSEQETEIKPEHETRKAGNRYVSGMDDSSVI